MGLNDGIASKDIASETFRHGDGALLNTGVITTTPGSIATIEFGRNFVDTSYGIVLTPEFAQGAGSIVPYIATKTVSGVNIVGAVSGTYSYIAAKA